MTAAEVQQRFAGGEIDANLRVARRLRGLAPARAGRASPRSSASGSTTTAAAVAGNGAVSPRCSAVSGVNEDAARCAAIRAICSPPHRAASASRASDDDGGDLFGSCKPVAQAQASAANSKIRGERNDNSGVVLAQQPRAARERQAGANARRVDPGGSCERCSGGEGSGLIDIRSMASAYLGGGGGAIKPRLVGDRLDRRSPGVRRGGFSEPAVIGRARGRRPTTR